jgi:hypothetical protein
VHRHDLPLPGILLHCKIQQTPTIRPWISLGIRRTRHVPTDIDDRHIRTDEPGLDGRIPLVGITSVIDKTHFLIFKLDHRTSVSASMNRPCIH